MKNLGPAVTEAGRKLLFAAVRAAEKRPRQFDIDTIIDVDTEKKPKKGESLAYCGTVGCIAGHMALAVATGAPDACGTVPVGAEYHEFPGVRNGRIQGPLQFAQAVLGCTEEQADALFLASHPDALNGNRVTARNLRARVRAWLRTGK